jgi:flagellar biogenesis protein FliO
LEETRVSKDAKSRLGGLAGWLVEKLRREAMSERHLTLVERIALAPKQSLALVEAEGHRLLVAFSADGAPVFHALNEIRSNAGRVRGSQVKRPISGRQGRISW